MINYKKLEFSEDQPGVILEEIKRFGDDRGDFINVPFLEAFKRSYIINNTQVGVVRAFHGHKNEGKLFYVPKGAFKFIIMNMNDNSWKEYILLASVPKVLFVPAGFYNGFVSLSEDSLLITYSTSSIDESRADDMRLPFDTLGENVWKINNR
jgi:dTDP-4-dehydrorhamnose 3,5-epimerase-like enzyme